MFRILKYELSGPLGCYNVYKPNSITYYMPGFGEALLSLYFSFFISKMGIYLHLACRGLMRINELIMRKVLGSMPRTSKGSINISYEDNDDYDNNEDIQKH